MYVQLNVFTYFSTPPSLKSNCIKWNSKAGTSVRNGLIWFFWLWLLQHILTFPSFLLLLCLYLSLLLVTLSFPCAHFLPSAFVSSTFNKLFFPHMVSCHPSESTSLLKSHFSTASVRSDSFQQPEKANYCMFLFMTFIILPFTVFYDEAAGSDKNQHTLTSTWQ